MSTHGRWATASGAASAAPWDVAARLEHLDGRHFVRELDSFARMLGTEVERGMPEDVARADLLAVLKPWVRRRAATCRYELPGLEKGLIEAALSSAAASVCARIDWDRAEDFLPFLSEELRAPKD